VHGLRLHLGDSENDPQSPGPAQFDGNDDEELEREREREAAAELSERMCIFRENMLRWGNIWLCAAQRCMIGEQWAERWVNARLDEGVQGLREFETGIGTVSGEVGREMRSDAWAPGDGEDVQAQHHGAMKAHAQGNGAGGDAIPTVACKTGPTSSPQFQTPSVPTLPPGKQPSTQKPTQRVLRHSLQSVILRRFVDLGGWPMAEAWERVFDVVGEDVERFVAEH
jgi:hypothetical protein